MIGPRLPRIATKETELISSQRPNAAPVCGQVFDPSRNAAQPSRRIRGPDTRTSKDCHFGETDMEMIKNFAKSESGAVTVDWVVLTAAIVGLGLAVMAVVSGGIEDLSGNISGALTNTDPLSNPFNNSNQFDAD
jgi:Flp pilus assembly pilin Flp